MGPETDLDGALHNWLKPFIRGLMIVDSGTVTAVDETAFTADVLVNDGTSSTNFYACPLQVLVSAQGSMTPIPVIGSPVLLGFRDGSIQRPQILMVHQIDKLLISANNIVLNGGGKGGLVLVNDLVTKLNNLENLVNDLVAKYNSHTHLLTLTSGTGSAAPTTIEESHTLTPTQASDIESTQITQ